MRVRQITFNNFRSFRGEKTISFVDELTDEVRPMTVIAGTNGSGKTTILDTIFGKAKSLVDDKPLPKSVEIMRESGVKIWVSSVDFGLPPNLNTTFDKLRETVQQMEHENKKLSGGILYFPHNRNLTITKNGAIYSEKTPITWLYKFQSTNKWQGSLESFWVWQNYLDLERGNSNREALYPFVRTVENILGSDRKITIQEGRATILASYYENDGLYDYRLPIDKLPSGEQQVLLLFGELARRLRKGAVIMIDEPEASLHPSLQRLVVSQLQKIAREWDAQIILATHSLEILRAVHESEIIFLDHLEPV